MQSDDEDPGNLVYLSDFGLRGSNFYWHKYQTHGLTKNDILRVGLRDDRVRVRRELIDPLKGAAALTLSRGMAIYIKEGYRSKPLYRMVYQRRVQKYGQEQTDSLFNMIDMPHSTGFSIDVALWNPIDDCEIAMRNPEDGLPALFSNFYRGRTDRRSQEFQQLQQYLLSVMQEFGFRLGSRNEYFHFDFVRSSSS
jgi:D-alanyl-D-alanine dipeptidase